MGGPPSPHRGGLNRAPTLGRGGKPAPVRVYGPFKTCPALPQCAPCQTQSKIPPVFRGALGPLGLAAGPLDQRRGVPKSMVFLLPSTSTKFERRGWRTRPAHPSVPFPFRAILLSNGSGTGVGPQRRAA